MLFSYYEFSTYNPGDPAFFKDFLFTHKRTIICKMCDYFVPSKRSNQLLPTTSMWMSDGWRHGLDFCESSKRNAETNEEVWGECDDKLLIWSVFKLRSWTKPDSLWRKIGRQPRVDLRLGWMDGWKISYLNEWVCVCVCVWENLKTVI